MWKIKHQKNILEQATNSSRDKTVNVERGWKPKPPCSILRPPPCSMLRRLAGKQCCIINKFKVKLAKSVPPLLRH